jgi:hypothetical protein
MQHVDRIRQPHRINGPVCRRVIERHNFKHRPPAEAFQRLYGRVFVATLRRIESLPDITLNAFGLRCSPEVTQ